MAKSKGISVTVTGNTAPLRKSLKDANAELTAFGKAQASWGKAQALAYGVAGSAAAQFAISSVKAAMEDQKAQALLDRQLAVSAGANAQAQKAAEGYIDTLMYASNVSDDQLRPALGQLVRVTGDVTKAQKLLGLAVDVSVGGQKDLGTVVTALSKAAMGQTSSLARLGLGLSSAATQSGSLAKVTDELTLKFSGAASAAADTTAGRIENLNIRFGELKETIGYQLLPVVADASQKLLDFAQAAQSGNIEKTAKASGSLASGVAGFVQKVTGVEAVANAFRSLAWWANEADKAVAKTGDTADASAGKFRKMDAILSLLPPQYEEMRKRGEDYQKNVQDYLASQAEQKYQAIVDAKAESIRRAADATAKANAKQAAAKKEYADSAKVLRDDLAAALKTAQENLAQAKKEADDFGKTLGYSFGVSLADAYSAAKDGEDAYTAALKGRQDAYAALDVAKQGNDLNAYLKAVQDVATAEQAVTDAQKARVTPAAAFQKQIEDAKNFGSNLQTLISQGNLSQAGLQQLLDLGPTAGAEVTKALLDGTAGFTAGDLSRSLQGLADIQSGLAASITGRYADKTAINSAQSMVDALSSASIAAPGVGQGFTININTGVGDPVEIGRQVKEVLTQYDNRAGSLIVQGGKKKGKK